MPCSTHGHETEGKAPPCSCGTQGAILGRALGLLCEESPLQLLWARASAAPDLLLQGLVNSTFSPPAPDLPTPQAISAPKPRQGPRAGAGVPSATPSGGRARGSG